MTKDELRAKANELPLLPGVYLMMDKTGQVIYVGKAIKLKNRVSQYFQDTASHNDKTRRMVSQVDRFDTIIVRTEFEALILENSLIKRHMPRYNILLKDDKGYPFVRLDEKADYPRFTLVTRPAEDGARYFGPFGGRSETRQAIDAVCAALRLPTCSRRFPRDIGKERPCLNHHIGRCDGFCRPDGPDAAEYRRRIAQAVRLFEGRLRQVTAELTAQMTAAAEALDFEQAAALRDRIRALSVLSKNQKVIAGICADTDVWGVYTGPARAGCAVLHIENGDLLGRRVEVLPVAEDDAALLGAVVPQYYLDRELLPREILLPLPMVRSLFDYEKEVSAIELSLVPGADINSVKSCIKSLLGDDFSVKDRYEQQEASFRMMQGEKWMIFLILCFILILALFNVIGSLSMLMIEKKEDVRTLRNMGADDRLIRRIFLFEGWMISGLGALIGIVIGLALCLLQQELGIIKLGQAAGSFIIDAYPVRVEAGDILIVFITVLSIGFLAAWYPVHYLGKKWLTR